MPIYAQYGVSFAWLIDPIQQTLEAYASDGSDWKPHGNWRGLESPVGWARHLCPPFQSEPGGNELVGMNTKHTLHNREFEIYLQAGHQKVETLRFQNGVYGLGGEIRREMLETTSK